MVYTRMVYSYHDGKRYGPYGPYRYESVREGPNPHVRSVYLGAGQSGSMRALATYETTGTGKPLKKHSKTIWHKLRGVETFHLRNICNKYEIDYHEIDGTLTYAENKKHLEEIAEKTGSTREEVKGESERFEEWEGEYGRYKQEFEREGWKEE